MPGQLLALEVLQAGAATGRDVAERGLVEAERADRGGGVAAADDGEPVDLGQRLGDGAGALGERRDLEDAHRAVPEHRAARRPARAAKARAGLRADVEAERVGRDLVGGDDARLGSRSPDGNAVSTTMSVGSTISHAGLLGPLEVGPAGVELVLLEQALADLVALGREEGEDHAAADQQPVGLAEQVVDDAELVGDLGAAEHDDVGPLGVLGQPPQHVDLAWRPGRPSRAAAAARRRRRDACLRCTTPKPSETKRVGERGELVGERAALGVVLAGLARR